MIFRFAYKDEIAEEVKYFRGGEGYTESGFRSTVNLIIKSNIDKIRSNPHGVNVGIFSTVCDKLTKYGYTKIDPVEFPGIDFNAYSDLEMVFGKEIREIIKN